MFYLNNKYLYVSNVLMNYQAEYNINLINSKLFYLDDLNMYICAW